MPNLFQFQWYSPRFGVTRAHFMMTSDVFVSHDCLGVSMARKRAISCTAPTSMGFAGCHIGSVLKADRMC